MFCQSATAARELERVTGQVTSEHRIGAALAGGAQKALDVLFNATYHGAAKLHRLREARHLLRCTEPAVLDLLVNWRKGNCWVYTNKFAQCYVLSSEWGAIKDIVPWGGMQNLSFCSPFYRRSHPTSADRDLMMALYSMFRYCHSHPAPQRKQRS